MPSAVGVFEESFELVKKNYVKFLELYIIVTFILFVAILLALFLAIGLGLFASIAASGSSSSGIGAGLTVFLIVVLIIAFLTEPIFIGAYYSMALQALKGKISVTYALNQAVSKYVQLLWTLFLESLVFIVIDVIIFSPLLFALPGFISASSSYVVGSGPAPAGVLSFVGLLIMVVILYFIVTVLLSPLFFEAVPLVMIEGTDGTKAIRESIKIGETRFWSVLGLIVLMVIVAFMIGLAQGAIVGVANLANKFLGTTVDFVLGLLVGSFVGGWTSTLPIIFYRDFLGIKAKPANRAR